MEIEFVLIEVISQVLRIIQTTCCLGSVKSEKGGKRGQIESFEWVVGINTAVKIPRKPAFANVFAIVGTIYFQMNLSMSFVHLCL
jgi:hypothetical protein